MHRRRPITKFRACLEQLEGKKLLSSGALPTQAAQPEAAAAQIRSPEAAAQSSHPKSLGHAFLAYRITQPNRFNNKLIPPFPQVLVQARQPIPGRIYNVLFISVRNGTARTFNASNGFLVRLPGGHSFPILTGGQQWLPGQRFVFYALTKKYYPLAQVPGGFEFDLGGGSSTLIPGPSGIYLGLRYNPRTFARLLDTIVAFGQGAQGGKGATFGLPDTAINEFVSARTRRRDFGGHF
jgi:hypothetical protein